MRWLPTDARRVERERGNVVPSRTIRKAGQRVPPLRNRSQSRSASNQGSERALTLVIATVPVWKPARSSTSWSIRGVPGWNSRRSIHGPVTKPSQASVPSVSPPSVPSVSPPSVPSVSPPSVSPAGVAASSDQVVSSSSSEVLMGQTVPRLAAGFAAWARLRRSFRDGLRRLFVRGRVTACASISRRGHD